MTKIDLTGKRALVTGGTQGIGEHICKELAACGADVFINYFNEQEKGKAENVARFLKHNYQVQSWIVQGDVSKSEEVIKMFLELDEKMGGIDILINNAGVESTCHVLDLEEKEWDRIMGTNLKGTFLCSQQAGKRMEKTGGGAIINISTIHDQVPRKGLSHYVTSKAGISMLTKSLALELAESNIRVNAVSPGAIQTEANKKEIAKFGIEKFNNWIPLGRIGNVNDVAPTVAFLCSDLAEYTTGTEIYIDGAYLLSTIQYDPRPPRKEV